MSDNIIPLNLEAETSMEISDAIRDRLMLILEYDYRRIPYRVASAIRDNFRAIAWFDGERFYYGAYDGSRESVDESIYIDYEWQMHQTVWRGGVTFHTINKPLTNKGKRTKLEMLSTSLDDGYIEFFMDVLSGDIGIDETDENIEIWRRHGMITDQIVQIEKFYGVSKPIAGVLEIFLDMVKQIPEIAPMKVKSCVSIGNVLYGGFEKSKLEHDMIPKLMLPEIKLNLKKAFSFFNMICPDEDSRHNLMMATVYPYYKRSSEKFFAMTGPGGNGKGRYMKHFKKMLGDKYTIAELDVMGGKNFDSGNAVAALQGKLVYNAPEADLNEPTGIKQLKSIASADDMSVRTIGKDRFTFTPTGTLFVDTNSLIDMGDTDAMQRRQVFINFAQYTFTHEEFAPYYYWVLTPEGYASIFAAAYAYYTEEGCGNISFRKVEPSYGENVASSEENFINKIVTAEAHFGWERAFVKLSTLANFSANERRAIFERYGLKKQTKYHNGERFKAIMIDDHDLFKHSCAMNGIERAVNDDTSWRDGLPDPEQSADGGVEEIIESVAFERPVEED